MNINDYFAGETHFGFSRDTNGPLYVNEWSLIPNELLKRSTPDDFNPQPFTVVAPVILTSLQFHQRTGGTAICYMLFDGLTSPPDGTVVNAAPSLRTILKAAAATTLLHNPSGPAWRFNTGFSVVASTNESTVTRANASTFFSVTYASYHAG